MAESESKDSKTTKNEKDAAKKSSTTGKHAAEEENIPPDIAEAKAKLEVIKSI